MRRKSAARRAGRNTSPCFTANARWQLTRLSEDPSSAPSVEMKDAIARDVVTRMGVPTQLVGIPGSDTYANLAHARVGLLTEPCCPPTSGYTLPSSTAP